MKGPTIGGELERETKATTPVPWTFVASSLGLGRGEDLNSVGSS